MTRSEEIVLQAKEELKYEAHREAVDKMKLQLKRKRKWFPWRIVLINLNSGD